MNPSYATIGDIQRKEEERQQRGRDALKESLATDLKDPSVLQQPGPHDKTAERQEQPDHQSRQTPPEIERAAVDQENSVALVTHGCRTGGCALAGG